MFRKTSAQSSFFEVNNYFSGVLPEEDWCFIYWRQILPLINENDFRHFYSESDGRCNASIRTMVSMLIFMGLEQLNWREAEFLFPRRFDWLIATETPVGNAFLDHTTLFKFYQRLDNDETAQRLFVKLTDSCIKFCGTSLKKQRTDSFFVHGWLRLLTRYGLLKETIRKFLQVLRKQKPGLYKNVAGQLSRNYFDGGFDFPERDKEMAKKKISLMARDLYRLKCAFEHHEQVKHYDTFQILLTVLSEQCEIRGTGSDPEIIVKTKVKSGICSPHNTEAQFARKGGQRVVGDKAVVTETCDPENKTQFIVDVELVKAPEHDSKHTPQIQERLTANNFKPEKQYADAGFVSGTNILDSQDHGIHLEGPTPGHSHSLSKYQSDERRFDAGDFTIHIDEKTQCIDVVKCPNNQIPVKQEKDRHDDIINVHFDGNTCRACPYAPRCPVRRSGKVAIFRAEKRHIIGAVRHHQYMSDPEYRKECAIRAGAEAMVSELTRAHGMRKSRHRATARTRLQLIFATIACNVKRFIRHCQLYGGSEPEMA